MYYSYDVEIIIIIIIFTQNDKLLLKNKQANTKEHQNNYVDEAQIIIL